MSMSCEQVYMQMPQSQNMDYNGSNNNSAGVAVASQIGQYAHNSSIPSHIPMLNPSLSNQSMIAATMHLNKSNQHYVSPGYIYPNNNTFAQTSNIIYNPQNIHPPPVEMISSGQPTLNHLGSGGGYSQKLSSYDNVQHFGSLLQTVPRKPKISVMSKTNLYINGLQDTDTDESVRALVEGVIEPKSCKAMMSHGKCRGSGFIDCANENDADAVIRKLRNMPMPGGNRLAVKFAYENEKDDLNVYVRNLPRSSDFGNNNLEDMFKEFGQVVSVKLLQSDNQYTGTGFVRFSAAEEAQKAVDQINVKKLLLTEEDKAVICKLADKGGRRMNHNMVGVIDSSPGGHRQSLEGDQTLNGPMSQLSPEGVDKSLYGMPQYAPQGQAWFSPDMLAQELQSLGLAPNYLVPALMQGGLAVPYGEEAAFQQQMLAQLLWAHQNSSRMVATPSFHAPPVGLPQQPPLVQWPPHHVTGNNVYYGTEHPYPPLLYQPQPFRHSRSPGTLKASPSIEGTLNGQGPSASHLPPQCAVNGADQAHLAKM